MNDMTAKQIYEAEEVQRETPRIQEEMHQLGQAVERLEHFKDRLWKQLDKMVVHHPTAESSDKPGLATVASEHATELMRCRSRLHAVSDSLAMLLESLEV